MKSRSEAVIRMLNCVAIQELGMNLINKFLTGEFSLVRIRGEKGVVFFSF